MGDYQQFIEKILDDFDEEAGSTIKPHKQCATLVFNRHIDADQVWAELVKIIQECGVLKTPYKNVDTTIMGGYIIKFWTMDHLDTFLKKHYIYNKNKRPHQKMISIYRHSDQNRWIRGLTKLPPTIISKLLLKVHHMHCTIHLIHNQKNKQFKGCAHVLCKSLEDAIHLDKKKGEITFDGINLCKVDIVNKKWTNTPPEEQPVPHTQTL
ncbi:uncharacterized protein ACA1_143050 [Acanthamoeba castellanii str. Neff]|uniref:Uncharacterized protein n=1 Tax=Acanthamoeba castellanii (strain ATCC 30010 / Neff) TaxID=1257118 RepID=L8HFN2_ACACF|nr:uncharacterized protein ACA1_143050 [Acanthamoeba castellanii str. Neff]ELR23965.1 hypothetical protein ACA1_143050 [Acanthamoeba castellanii str. Neff]